MIGRTLRRQSSWRAALARLALPLVVGACGPAGLPDMTLFDAPDCTETGGLGLDGLRPSVPVDYMELRERQPDGSLLILTNSGDQCARAMDLFACQAALVDKPSLPGFHPCTTTDCGHSLATTKGDLVNVYPDAASLLGFLGTIDTSMEALMWVYAQGYDISCTDKTRGGVRAALNGDGYEVLASLISPSCNPTTITGYQFHVTRRGVLTYFTSWPVPVVPGMLPCP